MSQPVSNRSYVVLNVLVEALGTAKTRYVHCPVSGIVRSIAAVVDVAVDDNNVITSSIDGTAITGGGFTLTTAQTAGLGKSCEPTGANRVRKGQSIGIITDGGGGAGQANFSITIEQD